MDPYEVLGVSRDATVDEIRNAYRALMKKYHPDVNKGPDAVQMTSTINEAYDRLVDSAGNIDTTTHPSPVPYSAEEIRQQERYWRWLRADAARKQQRERQWLLEADAYRIVRKVGYLEALLCFLIALDFFLPSKVIRTIPILGYQTMTGGRRNTLANSYMRTPIGDLKVPHMVHVDYDYSAEHKAPIELGYTPLFSTLKSVKVFLQADHIVLYRVNSPYTPTTCFILGFVFLISIVNVVVKKYRPVLLLLCLINFILTVFLLVRML